MIFRFCCLDSGLVSRLSLTEMQRVCGRVARYIKKIYNSSKLRFSYLLWNEFRLLDWLDWLVVHWHLPRVINPGIFLNLLEFLVSILGQYRLCLTRLLIQSWFLNLIIIGSINFTRKLSIGLSRIYIYFLCLNRCLRLIYKTLG